MTEDLQIQPTETTELSKTERRRQAKKRKKERLARDRLEQQNLGVKKRKTKPKMTKAERKEKYTQRAIDRRTAKVQKKRESNMICFHCRKKGHSAMNCPESGSSASVAMDSKICYKCGSTEHSLAACPKRKKKRKQQVGGYNDEELPYATCFVCGEMGHLASQCEQNTKGVFVSGGACRECGEKDHIAADCPRRRKQLKSIDAENESCILISTDADGGQGDDDPGMLHDATRDESQSIKSGNKRKVVNF